MHIRRIHQRNWKSHRVASDLGPLDTTDRQQGDLGSTMQIDLRVTWDPPDTRVVQ